MKTIILILILVAFLQSTVIPLDLVPIILICRAYLDPERVNLILAFSFGLLVAHLTLGNLGLQSLVYLILVSLAQIFSKTRFSTHWLLVLPLTFILLSGNVLIFSLVNKHSVQIFPKILIESMLALPIFYLVKVWEERFIIKKDLKLRF